MFGRRRRLQRWFDQGEADEMRRQRDELLRRAGQRPGDDTEPPDLSPDEREAYEAGRRLARGTVRPRRLSPMQRSI